MFEKFLPSKSRLSDIRHLPKNEQRDALEEFKADWFRKRSAFSDYLTALEREIETCPNISQEELRERIASSPSAQEIPQNQRDALSRVADLFCEQRENAKDFFSKWHDKNPSRILKELTGLELDEIKTFQIKKGLMTVDIETDSITANKIFHDNPELREPCSFSGFHKKSRAKGADISYIVIPEENTENEKNYKHEEQHARNRMFQSVFEEMISDEEKTRAWKAYFSASGDGEEKFAKFRNGIDIELSGALQRAKDEIFAFSHNADPDIALRQLLNNDDYDYFQDAREKSLSDGVLKEERRDYFDATLEKYRKIVSQGFQSFERLNAEFRNASPISFLTDQPLISWPSYVEKLIREKHKLN
jgi:hypothetical protein